MATLNEKMTAIADAVRDKTGKAAALTLDDIAADIPKVYEAGKAEESRVWWDCITNGNKRTVFDFAFYQTDFGKVTGGWNPPYRLKPTYAPRMFYAAAGITKIKKEQIDTANNNSANYMFANCRDLEEIEEIEIGSDCMYAFSSCTKLKTIGKLIIRSGITGLSENSPPFAGCTALENITIEGAIPYTLGFAQASKLTAESIESIVSALSDESSGQALTFNKAVKTTYYNAHTDEYTDADEAWNTLCAAKSNWSISLV